MTEMNKAIWWLVPGILLVAAALLYYQLYYRQEPTEAPAVKDTSQPAASAPASLDIDDEPLHVIPLTAREPEEQAPPLPTLDDSDAPMSAALTELLDQQAAEQFLIPESLVRHIVVTIDNLPREKVAVEKRPLKSIPGPFLVSGTEETIALSSDNYSRYEPFAQLVEATDTEQITATYFRFYPLFQDAYEELGYPSQYFNDRLVEVIDHLLATPEVGEPVELVRPHVLYQYADPELEARSAGEKLLIRMGPGHTAIIKAKLQEIRDQISVSMPPD